MGNIQQFCGESACFSNGEVNLNKSSNVDFTGNNSNRIYKTLNDYQEILIKKGIAAWKRLLREKKDPFSTRNLSINIVKLDKFIERNKGKFIDLKTFEQGINFEILTLYQKLAIKEKKLGFKSFENKSLEKLKDKNIQSANNQFDFLFLRKPVLLNESKNMYLGQWNLSGEQEGYGKLINQDGSLIEGYFQKNGFCNYGRYFFTNGTYYEGGMKNNLPSSEGILKFFDTDIYSGLWNNGKYHGKGSLQINNKLKYQGEFLDDMFNGEGDLKYSDPDEYFYNYKGKFLNGKFDGEGLFKINKNQEKEFEEYKGNWKNGLPDGEGVYHWKNGNIYEGFYSEGKKTGKGKYTFNNGKCFYEGLWSNGKPNGKGSMNLENNIKILGIWKQGKIQMISNMDELNKENFDHKKIEIQIDTEIFSNYFSLQVNYITTIKENAKEIYLNENNGKIKNYSIGLKNLSNGLEKNIEKILENQN